MYILVMPIFRILAWSLIAIEDHEGQGCLVAWYLSVYDDIHSSSNVHVNGRVEVAGHRDSTSDIEEEGKTTSTAARHKWVCFGTWVGGCARKGGHRHSPR